MTLTRGQIEHRLRSNMKSAESCKSYGNEIGHAEHMEVVALCDLALRGLDADHARDNALEEAAKAAETQFPPVHIVDNPQSSYSQCRHFSGGTIAQAIRALKGEK